MFALTPPQVRRQRLRIVPLRWDVCHWCPIIGIKLAQDTGHAHASYRILGRPVRPKRHRRIICAGAICRLKETFCLLPRKRARRRPVRADRRRVPAPVARSRLLVRLAARHLGRIGARGTQQYSSL